MPRPKNIPLICPTCNEPFLGFDGQKYCKMDCRRPTGRPPVAMEVRFWAKVNKNGPIPEKQPLR